MRHDPTSTDTLPGIIDLGITTAPLSPTETGVEFAEALKTAADDYLATQRPKNTIDAYAEDWKVWVAFCTDKAISWQVSDPDLFANLLVAFVVWMEHDRPGAAARPYAEATMIRRVTGTVKTMRDRLGEIAVPKGVSARAAEAISGYATRMARANITLGRGEAALITTEMLIAMIGAQPDTLVGLRNKVLLLVWYHLGGRRAELAELLVTDIEDDGEVLIVHMRDSKTGSREPVIVRKPGSDYDPVAFWYDWLEASGITEGPAFPRMNRWGHLLGAITPKSIGTVVTTAGRAAGITIHLTGHGMRAGHVTTALEAGADPKTVGQQTGHDPSGRALWRYKRRVDRRRQNTSALIDLDTITTP